MTACSAFGSMIQANLKNGRTFCDGIPKCQPGTVDAYVCVCVQMRSLRLEPSGDQVMCVKYRKIRSHVSYLSKFHSIFSARHICPCVCELPFIGMIHVSFQIWAYQRECLHLYIQSIYSLRSFYSIRFFLVSSPVHKEKRNMAFATSNANSHPDQDVMQCDLALVGLVFVIAIAIAILFSFIHICSTTKFAIFGWNDVLYVQWMLPCHFKKKTNKMYKNSFVIFILFDFFSLDFVIFSMLCCLCLSVFLSILFSLCVCVCIIWSLNLLKLPDQICLEIAWL